MALLCRPAKNEGDPVKPFERKQRWLLIFSMALIVYLALAYVALPALWKHHEA